jgi:hypothetical protein
MSIIKYEQFLSHFRLDKRNGDKVQAHCPVHNDKHGSLSITLAGDKILIFCHAGCSVDSILLKAGLRLSDLFLNGQRTPEAIYQYRKADSSLSYEKVKYRNQDGSKTFNQRRLDTDGSLKNNLNGIKRIPYNLPAVHEAIKVNELILYLEGEKDCETARLLGYTATTMGGASDWKPEYKYYFKNARIVQVPDKDEAGIKLAQDDTKSINEVCRSLKVVILPEGKDFTEWVIAGHTRADFEKLIGEAPELVKPVSKNTMVPLSEWRERVLEEPATDDLIQDILPNCSSEYLLLCGRSGIGKTNLALHMAFCLAAGKPWFGFKVKQCKVGYLVFEGAPKKLLLRVDKLLKSYPEGEGNFYFDRHLPFKLVGPGIQKLQELMEGLDVCFIDPIRYIIPGDYTKPEFASNFISSIKVICQKTGTILILLHHVKKPDIRLKVRPEDLQYEVKGATDYVDAAGTLLLLERARQARNSGGKFGSNSDDRTLYFCKVKDAPAELLPLNLQFNRDTLVYEPITLDYPDEEDI